MNDIFKILSEENKENKKNLNENKIQSNNIEKEEEKDKKRCIKKEYYPIGVIEEAKKYYNLSNESKEDLYPLNTYQTYQGLTIDFINAKENKFVTKNSSILSCLGLYDKDNIYICTNDGQIIKK